MGFDAEQLARRLEALAVGETVSYADLSKIIGEDVQRKRRSALRTARAHLLRTRRLVLEAVRDVGIKRVDGAELVNVVSDGVARGRRHFGRVAQKSASCTSEGYAGLSPEERVRLDASRAIAQAIRKVTSGGGVKRIEVAVEQSTQIPVEATLALFTRGRA